MTTETNAVRSVFIEGREWFDKTYGNSYWSSQVQINGKVVMTLGGLHYGYGDFYQHATLQELIKRGLLAEGLDSAYALRQAGIDYYTTKATGKKRDLHKELKFRD